MFRVLIQKHIISMTHKIIKYILEFLGCLVIDTSYKQFKWILINGIFTSKDL